MGTPIWTDTLELHLYLEDLGLAMRLIRLVHVELSIGLPLPLLLHVYIARLGTSATVISINDNVMVMFSNAFCIFCFRYCDCFANGEFCNNCNCTNCYNNLDHENDRQKAIKVKGLFLFVVGWLVWWLLFSFFSFAPPLLKLKNMFPFVQILVCSYRALQWDSWPFGLPPKTAGMKAV